MGRPSYRVPNRADPELRRKRRLAGLTDSGQAFNALTTHPTFAGFELGHPPRPPDAVVHLAAIPRVLIEPDNVTFATNVISTYNVIEAAMKLGVRKVVIASSETTYGVCFAESDKDFHSFPLEEDYDVDPMNSRILVPGKAPTSASADGASGVFDRVLNRLASNTDAEYLMIDATIVPQVGPARRRM